MIKFTLGLIALGIVGGLATACGSDSDSSGGSGTPSKSEVVALCKRVCEKEKECVAGGAGAQLDCDELCTKQTDESGTPPKDCDYGKVESAVNACLKKSCDDYHACIADSDSICPDDGAGGGTGGASGTGGRSSTGGSSSDGGGSGDGGSSTGTGGASTGGGDCSICDKANKCCAAVSAMGGDKTGDCGISTSACEETDSAEQSQYVSACDQFLTIGKQLNLAECK